jgi:hypothetical protein
MKKRNEVKTQIEQRRQGALDGFGAGQIPAFDPDGIGG